MIHKQIIHKIENLNKVRLGFYLTWKLKERKRGGGWWLWGLWVLAGGVWVVVVGGSNIGDSSKTAAVEPG